MNFFDAVAKRRSVRSFLPTSISEEKLRCVLEAAASAPSAGNLQSYEMYVVKGKRKREDLARAAHEQLFIASAPISLVFCTHASRSAERYGKRAEKLHSIQDATIACSLAMLAATAEGLASVWVGAFEPGDIRRIIGAPPGIVPVAILPLGYAAEHPYPPERRPLNEMVHRVE